MSKFHNIIARMQDELASVDLNLLVTLDAVFTERSVSRAASRLQITQSAVSHSLRRLRTTFGDPLVIRRGAGIVPTPRGAALQDPIRALLAQARAILNQSTAFDPKISSRVFRLSMSDAMSVEALPLILQRLRRDAPGIDLVISTSGPRQSCEKVSADDVDLAIGVYPRLLPGLRSRELYRDTLVCVADRNNPRLKNGRLDLKSYMESPHVTVAPNSDTGIQLDEILEALGMQRRIAVSVPHYLSVPGLIRGTDVIAHTRRRLLSVFRNTADLAVFAPPVKIPIPQLRFLQVWHIRYDRDPAHRWLRDTVLTALSAEAPGPSESEIRPDKAARR
jgi:DNA-binding transcriptional LysR family regulator